MRYLEDHLSEEMIDTLTYEIAKICDDDLYIDSTLSAFETDDDARELLEFLKKHPEATRSDIDFCTVRIYNKTHPHQ